MSKFPERLRAIMAARKTTQAELAKLIGVTPGTLSAYLKDGEGRKVPTLDTLERIAQRLNVSIGWLCGEDNNLNALFSDSKLSYSKLIAVLEQLLALDGGKRFISEFGSVYDLNNEEYVETLDLRTRDEYIVKFFVDRQKVWELYANQTIDQEMYDAWIEKRLRSMENVYLEDDPSF